jgi:hypothetical protein
MWSNPVFTTGAMAPLWSQKAQRKCHSRESGNSAETAKRIQYGGISGLWRELYQEYMKVIPITNIFLALSVIALQLVYSGLHWFIPRLYAVKNMPTELKHEAWTYTYNVWLLATVIAIISFIIGCITVKEKTYNPVLSTISLVISGLALVFSLLLTTM